MKNKNGKRPYLCDGSVVAVRLGFVGRPPKARILENEYIGDNCHHIAARLVEVLGGMRRGDVRWVGPGQVVAR